MMREKFRIYWKDAREGEIKEAVRFARFVEPSNSRVTDNYVELKRTDESATVLRIVWRTLPPNDAAGFCFSFLRNTPSRLYRSMIYLDRTGS